MTIRKKLDMGIGILLALFLLLGAVYYFETKQIDESLTEITEVKEPTSAAAFEMEINLIGTGFGVLGYIHDHDPLHLERIRNDEADFEEFQKKYHKLAETPKGKELGDKIDKAYDKFKVIADKLIELEDEQTRKMELIAKNFEQMDAILDDNIQASIKPDEPQANKKMQASMKMEININGIAKGLGKFLMTHNPQYEERVHHDEEDFYRFFEIYRGLSLSSQEKEWAGQINSLFDENIKLAKKIIELGKVKEKDLAEFVKIRREMDALLDEEIQVLTHTDLEKAKEAAHKTVGIAAIVTLILVFAGFIIGFVSYATITRSITKRITTLRDATSIIGKGELDTQIEIEPNDEIGELAASFNDMAHKLKESHTHLEKRVQGRTAELTAANRQLTIEVTKRKKAKAQLQATQEKLIGAARRAGMSEVATGVLHNVGNVLNSAGVTTESIQKKVRNSKVSYLTDVVNLLEENADNLGELMTNDERGKKLPAFLANLSKELIEEQGRSLEALETLTKHIEHTANIIQLQQSYSKTKGLTEPVSIAELVEDTIRINTDTLTKHSVEVKHELVDLPPLLLDRHKVLQILTNLISNAKKALSKNGRDEKILTIRVKEPEGGHFRIEVSDNGIGIVEENLTQIFKYKFTTSEDGHGFGLHSAALAANEMNGSLSARSDGPGKGAVFTLELPFKTQETAK